jgi:hypothetical protein
MTEKTLREQLTEKLREGIPRAKPKPRPLGPSAEVTELAPWSRRRWIAEPVGVTSAQAMEIPDAEIRLAEIREANARAARAARRLADPVRLGHWGPIED